MTTPANSNGKPQEGLELMRSATELVVKTRGAGDNFHTPYAQSVYGRALVKFGRTEEGSRLLVQAIENRRKNRPGTRQLAQMLESQAAALIDLGRHADADIALNEAAGIRAKIGDTLASGLLNAAVLTRADLFLASDRPEDARQLVTSLPPPSDDVDGISRTALDVALMTARTELARGQAAVAIETSAHARRQIEASRLRGFLAQYEARAALTEGQAQLLAQHPASALEALKRSEALSAALYDRNSPVIAQVEIALAECHLALGEKDQARAAYVAASKIHAVHAELGPQIKVRLHTLQARLAQTHEVDVLGKR